MKATQVSIPPHIWNQLRRYIPRGQPGLVVELKLKNGRRVRDMAVDSKGRVEGMVIGSQDGVSDDPLNFTSDDIVAARVGEGILGVFGLTRWKS